MLAKEIITEWSNQDTNINKRLIKLGYKKIGAGVDQTAWEEPGGEILKIFGTNKSASKAGFSADHLMFDRWAKLCKANSSNPFFPKFSGWESFQFDGKMYLQIRMERLQRLPVGLDQLLEEIASVAQGSTNRNKFIKEYMDAVGEPTWAEYNKNYKPTGTYLPMVQEMMS